MVKPVDHDVLLRLLASLPRIGGADLEQCAAADVFPRG
jgi:hypothetical protein